MKKLLAVFLLCSIMLSLCPLPSLAEGLMLPDPALFSDGALTFIENRDNENALQRWYTVRGDLAEHYASAYIDMLKSEPTLQYAGKKAEYHPDFIGVHHYFVPANAHYACFSIPGIQVNICLDVFYDYGGSYSTHNITIFCSTDFAISKADLSGIVPLSDNRKISSAPTAKFVATATPRPTATPTPTVQPTATPKPITSSRGFVLQDPVTFTGGQAEFRHDYDKSSHLQKEYKFSKSKVEGFINAYVSMLKEDPSLKYLGVTLNGENIYHCFAPAAGYSYKTFAVTSYGEKITPTLLPCHTIQSGFQQGICSLLPGFLRC